MIILNKKCPYIEVLACEKPSSRELTCNAGKITPLFLSPRQEKMTQGSSTVAIDCEMGNH
jgi:hypothetical protein